MIWRRGRSRNGGSPSADARASGAAEGSVVGDRFSAPAMRLCNSSVDTTSRAAGRSSRRMRGCRRRKSSSCVMSDLRLGTRPRSKPLTRHPCDLIAAISSDSTAQRASSAARSARSRASSAAMAACDFRSSSWARDLRARRSSNVSQAAWWAACSAAGVAFARRCSGAIRLPFTRSGRLPVYVDHQRAARSTGQNDSVLTAGRPADGRLLGIGRHRPASRMRPNGATACPISGSLPANMIA